MIDICGKNIHIYYNNFTILFFIVEGLERLVRVKPAFFQDCYQTIFEVRVFTYLLVYSQFIYSFDRLLNLFVLMKMLTIL